MTLSFLYLFPVCLAYIIDITPSTPHPAPSDKISWDITVGTGDPTIVNILLTSTSRGNTTIIADSTDLSKSSKGTFDVPIVPPGNYFLRLTGTSDTLLQDSSQFQIFAPGATSLPASETTSLPATSASQSSSTTLPTGQPDSESEKRKSSAPVGAIVGGVVGGIVVILAILAIVNFFVRPLWGRKKHLDDAEESDIYPTIKPHPLHPSTVEPYTVAPLSSSERGSGDNERSDTTSKFTSMSSKARMIQNSMFSASQQNSIDASSRVTVPISDSASVIPPGISRADYLRAERERINREIAMLEGASTAASTAGGSYGASSVYTPSIVPSTSASRDREIAEHLAVLQSQIRQIEARQAQTEIASGGGHQDGQFAADVEPPPGYYPPPASQPVGGPETVASQGQEQPSGSGRPQSIPVRSPLVDVKGPIGE